MPPIAARPLESPPSPSSPPTFEVAAARWLYHVTFARHLASIAEQGLRPGSGMNFGGFGGHAQGRVFLTTEGGVRAWMHKIEYSAGADDDRIGSMPVVLRLRMGHARARRADEPGNRDVGGPGTNWFLEDGIDPDAIEVWTGRAWVPVASFADAVDEDLRRELAALFTAEEVLESDDEEPWEDIEYADLDDAAIARPERPAKAPTRPAFGDIVLRPASEGRVEALRWLRREDRPDGPMVSFGLRPSEEDARRELSHVTPNFWREGPDGRFVRLAHARAGARARYVTGPERGEMPAQLVVVGDRVLFDAEFPILDGAPRPDAERADLSGDAEREARRVEAGAEGEVLEVHPESLVVRVPVVRGVAFGPETVEIPYPAVSVVLAHDDPRLEGRAVDVRLHPPAPAEPEPEAADGWISPREAYRAAQRVFQRAGRVGPETAAVIILHAACSRDLADKTQVEGVRLAGIVRRMGPATWSCWSEGARTLRRQGVWRRKGIAPRRARELAEWAVVAVGAAGARALGHTLSVDNREDVLWALRAILRDIEGSLPEEAYATEYDQIEAATSELNSAISWAESIPAEEWVAAAALPFEEQFAGVVELLQSVLSAERVRDRAQMAYQRAVNEWRVDPRAPGEKDARVVDAEATLVNARVQLAVLLTRLRGVPKEIFEAALTTLAQQRDTSALESVLESPPVPAPSPPVPAPPAPPEELDTPEELEEPEAPPEATPEELEEPTGPALIMGYSGYMGRNEWRFQRVEATPGMRVRNKNTGESGVVLETAGPYALEVETPKGAVRWPAVEVGLEPSWKAPAAIVRGPALEAWRAGLPRTAYVQRVAAYAEALLARGSVEIDPPPVSERLEALRADVLTLTAKLSREAGEAKREAKRADGSVWLVLPASPTSTQIPDHRRGVVQASITQDASGAATVVGPNGAALAYQPGAPAAQAPDGTQVRVFQSAEEAQRAFLEESFRPWLQHNALLPSALPDALLVRVYRAMLTRGAIA